VPQSDSHTPAESSSVAEQLVHWLADGPVHVVHDASHAAHPLSLVAVHVADWYWPAGQPGAVQVVQATLPEKEANVPALQFRHVRLELSGW
jgi:hypothetical protein